VLVKTATKAAMCKFVEYVPIERNDTSNILPPHWLNDRLAFLLQFLFPPYPSTLPHCLNSPVWLCYYLLDSSAFLVSPILKVIIEPMQW